MKFHIVAHMFQHQIGFTSPLIIGMLIGRTPGSRTEQTENRVRGSPRSNRMWYMWISHICSVRF